MIGFFERIDLSFCVLRSNVCVCVFFLSLIYVIFVFELNSSPLGPIEGAYFECKPNFCFPSTNKIELNCMLND